jgi:hypothetical protein
MHMAFRSHSICVRFLNVTSRPHANLNHRVFRSKRGEAYSPNTGKRRLPRKLRPTAPICSGISAKTRNDCWRRGYSDGPLAFIRRARYSESAGRRVSEKLWVRVSLSRFVPAKLLRTAIPMHAVVVSRPWRKLPRQERGTHFRGASYVAKDSESAGRQVGESAKSSGFACRFRGLFRQSY